MPEELAIALEKGLELYTRAELTRAELFSPGIRLGTKLRKLIVAAYIFKTEMLLKDVAQLAERGIAFTPKEVCLLVRKTAHKLNLHQIPQIFEDFSDVNKGSIKHFIISNPSNPEEGLRQNQQRIAELLMAFPEEDIGTINLFAQHNPENPREAIEKYRIERERLVMKYPDESVSVIRNICRLCPQDPEGRLKKYRRKCRELRRQLPDVEMSDINFFACYFPSNPKAAIRRHFATTQRVAKQFPNMSERLVKIIVKYHPILPVAAVEKYQKNLYHNRLTKRKAAIAKESALKETVKKIFDESYGTYGVGRMCGTLRKQGERTSYHKVSQAMTQMGLSSLYNRQRSISPIRRRKVSDTDMPNIVKGNTFDLPYQAASSDITFIRTGEGFLYLCIIKDIVTGEILGHATSGGLQKELVIRALNNATAKHPLGAQTIFHSDRGSQYTSKEFMSLVKSYGIKQSFSRISMPSDNGWAESFFSCFKREITYFGYFATRNEAAVATSTWIDEFYNIKQCRTLFPELINEIYPIFRKYDVPEPKLTIREMTSRWGSCQPKRGIITLNKRLIETPRSCIEYVIMHEFIHFRQPNHSKAFYELLSTLMPDWKERKSTLENGYTLR